MAIRYNKAHYAAYMEEVDIRLRDNNPPEIRITVERLKSEGFSEIDAKKFIVHVIVSETAWMNRKIEEFNLQRFIKNLNRLPADPEE